MAPPDSRARGSMWRGLMVLLLFLCCASLAAVVAVLMSDLNQRRYRLTVRAGHLYVERGMHLPRGFASYMPDSAALREAYAPIALPPNAQVPVDTGPFDERSDIDRALYTAVSAWATDRLKEDDPAAQVAAAGLVKRLEILPGLSEDQRSGLRVLRGRFAWQNGGRLLAEATALMRQAQQEYRLAAAAGGPRGALAEHWVDEVERRIQMYHDLVPAAEGGAAQ